MSYAIRTLATSQRYSHEVPLEGSHEPVPAERGDVFPGLSDEINLQMSYWIMGGTVVATLIAFLTGSLNG